MIQLTCPSRDAERQTRERESGTHKYVFVCAGAYMMGRCTCVYMWRSEAGIQSLLDPHLHLIHRVRVSHPNSEFTDTANLVSKLAPGIASLTLSSGTTRRLLCLAGNYKSAGESRPQSLCLHSKCFNHQSRLPRSRVMEFYLARGKKKSWHLLENGNS